MRIGIHVSGDEDVEMKMLGMAERLESPRPILEAVATALRLHVAEVFASEGHGTWEPLAESTIAAKGFDSILVETGAMRDSLTDEHGGDHFEEILGEELHFGSSDPKAPLHKSGTSRMPARDPVMIDETVERGIAKIVQRGIVEEDRAAFGVGSWAMSDLSMFGLT